MEHTEDHISGVYTRGTRTLALERGSGEGQCDQDEEGRGLSGPSWGSLGASWVLLVASLGPLEASWGLDTYRGTLGASLGIREQPLRRPATL